eukprot:CAMPEP_0195652228 /NCGR_PEP_ID=MMETSP0815-20121206/32713_1 /TAXON_ID=97485 /ORGANISM="Prymnesium parvum, Strain Texoma1" /LENGTH=67 /DNA_ID=CAMNT_0040796235 /DNA_START=81 /DNA_END=284 /DNA_ORIENTATION=-
MPGTRRGLALTSSYRRLRPERRGTSTSPSLSSDTLVLYSSASGNWGDVAVAAASTALPMAHVARCEV